MYLFNLLILFASCVYETQQWQYYNYWIYRQWEHWYAQDTRTLQMMRSYYEESGSRMKQLNPMRFMYEQSPYYEMGYIMGEIIERYRKVLEFAQKPQRFRFYTLFDILKNVELTQKLYFEIYHLVRMLHEIPRKYRGVAEYKNIEDIAGPELIGVKRAVDARAEKFSNMTGQQIAAIIASEQRVIELEAHRIKERERLKKKFQKIRQQFLSKGNISNIMQGGNRKKVTPWPIDYGWEINETLW